MLWVLFWSLIRTTVPWSRDKLNCTKYSLGAVQHSFGSVRQENWNTYEIHRVRATNDWIPTTHVMYTAKITTNIVLGERVQQQTDFRSIAAVQSFSYSSGRWRRVQQPHIVLILTPKYQVSLLDYFTLTPSRFGDGWSCPLASPWRWSEIHYRK